MQHGACLQYLRYILFGSMDRGHVWVALNFIAELHLEMRRGISGRISNGLMARIYLGTYRSRYPGAGVFLVLDPPWTPKMGSFRAPA